MQNGLLEVKQKIQRALFSRQQRTKGDQGTVCLVAVSKNISAENIVPVLDSGHGVFGENRVQECRDKWIHLKQKYKNIELHFIGALQTNKVKYLPGLIDVIQTVDRESLAQEIRKNMDKYPTWNPKCFIQLNTGAEPQKSGLLPKEADAFISLCQEKYRLNITGLMCIPPVGDPPSLHFSLLRKIAHRNSLYNLSMGMSDTYEMAIELGATHVRVGTAIFGKR